MDRKIVKKMLKYYDDPEFTPENVQRVSNAATAFMTHCGRGAVAAASIYVTVVPSCTCTDSAGSCARMAATSIAAEVLIRRRVAGRPPSGQGRRRQAAVP